MLSTFNNKRLCFNDHLPLTKSLQNLLIVDSNMALEQIIYSIDHHSVPQPAGAVERTMLPTADKSTSQDLTEPAMGR